MKWIRSPGWYTTRSSAGRGAFTTCGGIRRISPATWITPIVTGSANAQGHAVAAVRPRPLLVALACIGRQGHLNIIIGDPQIPHSSMSPPMQLDDVGHVSPPLRADDAQPRHRPGGHRGDRGRWWAELVHRARSTRAGTVFAGPVTEPSAVQFDPGARPALISAGSLLLAAAVGTDGSLACRLDRSRDVDNGSAR